MPVITKRPPAPTFNERLQIVYCFADPATHTVDAGTIADYVDGNFAVPCVDTNGALWTRLYTSNGAINGATPADGTAPALGVNVTAQQYLYNDATFDLERANLQGTMLSSAARTAATNSADFTNYNGKGAHFIIDCTTWLENFTPTIQGKDPVSGKYYDILIGNAITSVGTTVLKVYPGIASLPYASASDILPRIFRVSIAVAGAGSNTYSVGYALVN